MSTIKVTDCTSREPKYTVNKNGNKLTRRFLIQGLRENGGPDKLYIAATATANLPQYGSAHPTIQNLWVSNVECTLVPKSDDKVWYDVEYSNAADGWNAPTISWGSTFSTVKQFVDKDGVAMYVVPPPGVTAGANGTSLVNPGNGQVIKQPAFFDVQIPIPFLRVKKRIARTGTDNENDIAHFVGRVNLYAFRGQLPRTWYCSGIQFETAGLFYNVTYEFQLKYNTWDALYAFIDPDTGAPIQGITTAFTSGTDASLKTFRIYPEVDFGPLQCDGIY